jgi:predicted transcriptional regulator
MPLIDSYFKKSGDDQLPRDGVADKKAIRSARYKALHLVRSAESANINRILTPADVILPMREPYMQQIVNGEKNYEFRKYCLKASVKRIWFYSTAPQSSIEYICEILPAKTRNPDDLTLEEDGLGNKEFNERHKDWEGYDFAYEVLAVYRIEKPVTLKDLRNDHGIRSAPRGLVYTPPSLVNLVDWQKQRKVR